MTELINSLLNFLVGTGFWQLFFTPTTEGSGLFDLAARVGRLTPPAGRLS